MPPRPRAGRPGPPSGNAHRVQPWRYSRLTYWFKSGQLVQRRFGPSQSTRWPGPATRPWRSARCGYRAYSGAPPGAICHPAYARQSGWRVPPAPGRRCGKGDPALALPDRQLRERLRSGDLGRPGGLRVPSSFRIILIHHCREFFLVQDSESLHGQVWKSGWMSPRQNRFVPTEVSLSSFWLLHEIFLLRKYRHQ